MALVENFERETSAFEPLRGELVSRSDLDMQIVTAHRFPRSVKTFREDVQTLATLNEDVAGECSYALPRDGKTIEGPSARFAEILLNAWGNCRAGARIVADEPGFIVAQGAFHDLQRNVAVTFEVKRRITKKNGQRFNDDMIVVAGNAACSIALRNAVLKGIPKALWADLWSDARKVAVGDHKTLTNRRADALKAFQSYGVKPEQIFAFLSIRGIEDVSAEHLLTLRGLVTAFKEGDTTPEEVFAVQGTKNQNGNGQRKRPTLDDFGQAGTQRPEHPEQHNDADDPPLEPQDSPASAAQTRAPDAILPSGARGSIAVAEQRGRADALDGVLARGVPPEYRERGREDEASAWKASHARATAEMAVSA